MSTRRLVLAVAVNAASCSVIHKLGANAEEDMRKVRSFLFRVYDGRRAQEWDRGADESIPRLRAWFPQGEDDVAIFIGVHSAIDFYLAHAKPTRLRRLHWAIKDLIRGVTG